MAQVQNPSAMGFIVATGKPMCLTCAHFINIPTFAGKNAHEKLSDYGVFSGRPGQLPE